MRVKNFGEQCSRLSYLCQLADRRIRVVDHLGSDLDELLPHRCQRPSLDYFR